MLCLLLFLWSAQDIATPTPDQVLPPLIPWQGKSQALIAPKSHPWITPSEISGLKTSPNYQETMSYVRRLVAASPMLQQEVIGTSDEGREIIMIKASRDGELKPNHKKPLLLVHAGIHAGEIDGKDAGLMLLRDVTQGKKADLLNKVNLLFIPILNVDGHERSSAYNRINQRGPELMGWRTNKRNLNLNRDFAKIETAGVQALVKVINHWNPDLYLDIHVTDGMDYQYDITYGFASSNGYSPEINHWLNTVYRPLVDTSLSDAGHIPGPLIFAVDGTNPKAGIMDINFGPRFSHSYGDARHLPTILVENHSLKPFKQRVLGTYILIERSLSLLAERGQALRAAIENDRNRHMSPLPLTWKMNPEYGSMDFKGIAFERVASPITGSKVIRYLGKPETWKADIQMVNQVDTTAVLPKAYYVPPTWPEIIEKLQIHGIQMTEFKKAKSLDVEMYKLKDLILADSTFEGRVRVSAKSVLTKVRETFPKGTMEIKTNQPLGKLAAILLEPMSPDSFFQWGYFHEIAQRTEYFEFYAMEPMAAKMLEKDPDLKAEFEKKLAEDKAFASDPRARLFWFYERSAYFDQRWLLYPIGRD